MKNLLVIISLFSFVSTFSQNRIKYSQYYINQGVFNPGYFNPEHKFSGSTYYRKQWAGIEGAPTSKSLVLDYNIDKNNGLKLNIYQDKITAFNDVNIGLGYNWRTYTGKRSRLSLGVMVDYGIYSAALGDVSTRIKNDPAFSSISSNYFNVGFGAYWNSKTIFTGFSAPYLFNNSKDDGFINTSGDNISFNHFFYTLGARFGNQSLQFIPSTLITIVYGSPINVDLTGNLIYERSLLFGLGYRNDNSIIFSTGFIFLSDFKFVYSYDLTAFTTVQSSGSSGSHEITLGYGASFFDGKFSKGRRYMKKNMKRKRIPR